MGEIAARIAQYREQIDAVRARCGIRKEVQLMAVTKFVEPARINEAIVQGGIRLIGENRPQELVQKYGALQLQNVKVHQIGTLQRNKVKYIIDRVDMVESLESFSLAQEIAHCAQRCGKAYMDCLLEVNIAKEPNKSGVSPEELFHLYEQVASLPQIHVRGLMTIAPQTDDRKERLQYFSQTEKLFERLVKDYLPAQTLPLLSMGMTDSFEEAIACGADIVRIGTGIFGARSPLQR